jgi:hypothetical protein
VVNERRKEVIQKVGNIYRLEITTEREVAEYDVPVGYDIEEHVAGVVANWVRSRDGKVSFTLERLKVKEARNAG